MTIMSLVIVSSKSPTTTEVSSNPVTDTPADSLTILDIQDLFSKGEVERAIIAGKGNKNFQRALWFFGLSGIFNGKNAVEILKIPAIRSAITQGNYRAIKSLIPQNLRD